MADYCPAMRFGIFLLVSLLPVSALAQPAPAPDKSAAPQTPPIDSLFNQLKQAQTEQEARSIGDRIEKLFQQSGSASVDLLVARAAIALAANDNATARKLVDAVIVVAPDFAEGWHLLAGMQAASGDDKDAMLSLGKTITLNPRQFDAMVELAQMFEAYGNAAGALKLYRDAVAINPQMESAQFRIRALARTVEGQGI